MSKKNLTELGFTTFKNFFSSNDINSIEKCVLDLYLLQAKKIGEYSKTVIQLENDASLSNFDKFTAIYELLETNDKEALYQVQKYLSSSQTARNIFNEKFLGLCAQLLKSNLNALLVDGPAVFVNRPNTERLLYKWHSESHYYPKRRRFLNIWFPLFTKKTKDNGTMSFKVATHKKDFPFSEYQGFNKDTEKKSHHFIQYEIPNNFLNSFQEHWCEASPGDLVIFDKALVHRSNQNKSNEYSTAIVARVWDPSDDLTLSGNMAATPYGGNIGRSNFTVNVDVA